MDIGSVMQGLQAAIPAVPGDRTLSALAEDAAEPFESLLQPEVATDPETQMMWAPWPVALPMRAAIAPMPPEAAGSMVSLPVLDGGQNAALESGAGGGLTDAVLIAAGDGQADLAAPSTDAERLLPEAMPASGLSLPEGSTSLPLESPQITALPGDDTAPPAPRVTVQEPVARPYPATPMPPPNAPAAATRGDTDGLRSDGPSSLANGGAPQPLPVDAPVADMRSAPGQNPLPDGLPASSGYWRLVVEGLLAHTAGDPGAATALQVPEQAEGAGAIRPGQATTSGAGAAQQALPAGAVPPNDPMMKGDTLQDLPAADRLPVDAVPPQKAPQGEQRGAAPLEAARQTPVILPFSGVPPVIPDNVAVQDEGLQGLATSDLILTLTHTESGGADVAIRAASITQLAAGPGQEVTEIRLDPEELGRLRITLEGEGEAIRVRVEVERPETLDLLRRNGDRLAETLREAGYDQADMQFGSWSGERPPAPAQTLFGMVAEPEPAAHPPVTTAPMARPAPLTPGLNLRL